MAVLIPLADAGPEAAGGKGASLFRLAAQRLPVPPTWVIPADVFRAFLRDNGLWALAERGDPDLAARIRAAPLPPVAGIAPRMAVRSSALAEDGRVHSHAGVFESVLGVDAEGLPDAIRTCWASYYTPRALA